MERQVLYVWTIHTHTSMLEELKVCEKFLKTEKLQYPFFGSLQELGPKDSTDNPSIFIKIQGILIFFYLILSLSCER